MRRVIMYPGNSTTPGYKVIINEGSVRTIPTGSQPKFNPEHRRIPKKSKRFRSAFTTSQIHYLEEHFKQNQYIDRETRQKMAELIQIGERSIKIWFQNRRMKEKKEVCKEFDDETEDSVQNFGRYQLYNGFTPPSMNDNHRYLISTLPASAHTATYVYTNSMTEITTDRNEKPSTASLSILPLIKDNSVYSNTADYKEKLSTVSLPTFPVTADAITYGNTSRMIANTADNEENLSAVTLSILPFTADTTDCTNTSMIVNTADSKEKSSTVSVSILPVTVNTTAYANGMTANITDEKENPSAVSLSILPVTTDTKTYENSGLIANTADKKEKSSTVSLSIVPLTEDTTIYPNASTVTTNTADGKGKPSTVSTDTTTYVNANANYLENIAVSHESSPTKADSPNNTTYVTANNMVSSIEENISPPKANFYKELQNYDNNDRLSPYFNKKPIINTTVPFTSDGHTKKILFNEYHNITSAEFSIDLCKKYKQVLSSSADAVVTGNITNEDQNMEKEQKTNKDQEMENRVMIEEYEMDIYENKYQKIYLNQKMNEDMEIKTEPKRTLVMDMKLDSSLPKDLTRKKCKNPPPSTQVNLDNPMYYPVKPSTYPPPRKALPPPYVAPDGILWKPVNYVPVPAMNSSAMNNIIHQAPPAHEQNKKCICNCHESSQNFPVTLSPNVQNSYEQYIVTLPKNRF